MYKYAYNFNGKNYVDALYAPLFIYLLHDMYIQKDSVQIEICCFAQDLWSDSVGKK